MKSKFGTVMLLASAIMFVWTLPSSAAPEKVTTKAGEKVETPQPAGQEVAPKVTTKARAKVETPQSPEGPKELSPVQSYIFISEKNPFHPERKEFPVQPPPTAAGAAEVKKPIVRPQVVLHGVTIADEYESAAISSPGRPLRKGERETQTLRKGESVGEYKLAKILPDRIVLEGSGDSFEVLLYDPKAAKKRSDVKTENKPAVITSLSPTPAPAPAPAAPRPIPPRTGTEGSKGAVKVAEPPAPKPVIPAPVPTPVPSTGIRRTVPRALPRTVVPGTTPGTAEQ